MEEKGERLLASQCILPDMQTFLSDWISIRLAIRVHQLRLIGML